MRFRTHFVRRSPPPAPQDFSVIPGTLTKDTLRRAALSRRDAISPAERAEAAIALAARADIFGAGPGAVIAGYFPMRNEIDPRLLMDALAMRGAKLALPVVAARGAPLKFREWSPAAPLAKNAFGITEPTDHARELVPGILLIPLAAFDRAGHRIGYGAGFYDRTLAELRAHRNVVAAGVAFSVQEVDLVPALPHDARLDLVLTECETIDLRNRK